jgi:hypothetical protein
MCMNGGYCGEIERTRRTDRVKLTDIYDRYEDVSAAHRAWVTIDANRAGKSPKRAHAAQKAAFTRKQNRQRKQERISCEACPIKVRLDAIEGICQK